MRLLAAAALFFTCACNDTGDTCENRIADVGDVCMPASASPGIPLVLDVRELCGNGCSPNPSCSAMVRNATVILDVSQDFCVSYQSAFCLSQPCQQRIMHCTLPPLGAGRYTLTAPGSPARTILVEAPGQSSCRFTLPDGGVQ